MTRGGASRRVAAFVAVALLLAAPVAPAAASHLDNAVPVSGPAPMVAPDGPNVTVTGSLNASLDDPFPDAHTVELVTDEGNATFISEGPTDVAVQAGEINGTWTNVSDLDVATNELYIDPGDKSAVNVSGDTDSLSINETIAVDDGGVDFVYAGASGTTTLTVRGLPSATTVEAVDADTGTVLATDTTDGSGTAILSTMPNSEHDVELQSTSGGGGTAAATGGYEIASAKFIRDQSVADEPVFPQSVTFNESGTTMYVASTVNDRLYEYALSDPYNVSSATFTHSTNASGAVNNPTDIAFNTDGTKLFTTSYDGVVRGYSLSTPYDISTASLAETHDVSSEEDDPEGLAFNGTGTKLFVTGRLNTTVEEYSLSSNFAVSTASHVRTLDVSSQVDEPTDVAFNESGSSLFLTGGTDNAVYKYNLSANFDVSNVDLNTSVDVVSESGEPVGIAFDPNGTHMFLADREGSFTGQDIDDYEIVSYAPAVDNASASPTGDLQIFEQTLSINVSDSDFGDVEPDSVTVEFFVDGAAVGTDTLGSNGTASVEHTFAADAQEWHAVAEDDDGHTATSETFQITLPGGLEVRDVQTTELITGADANLTVRFFEEDNETVVTRTTDDGQINMTGLPRDTELIIDASADGYHQRRVVIESFTVQTTIYLLDENATTVFNEFTLVDHTASFPPGETKLVISRPINTTDSGPNTTVFRAVAGDYFGASQTFPVVLEQDERYRLVVENAEGDRRSLGSYVAASSGAVELELGEVEWPQPEDDSYASSVSQYEDDDGDTFIEFLFSDPSGTVEWLNVSVEDRFNESTVIYTENVTEPSDYKLTLELTDDQAGEQWALNYTAKQGDQLIHERIPIGGDFDVLTDLDPAWMNVLVVVLIVMLSAAYPGTLSSIGGVVVVAIAGMAILVGWFQVPVLVWFVALVIAAGGLIRAADRGEAGAA